MGLEHLRQEVQSPKELFEANFKLKLAPDAYERARVVFNTIGAYNEGGISIQMHIANEIGILPDILEMYEHLIESGTLPSSLGSERDLVDRAVAVRLYKDRVYGSMLGAGLGRSMEDVDVPDVLRKIQT